MDRYIRKLFRSRNPYDHQQNRDNFFHAMKAACRDFYQNSNQYRDICKLNNFNPEHLKSEEDLYNIPVIPTSYLKRNDISVEHSSFVEVTMILPKGVLFHIAAGNMDILPAYSVLEGLLTGNINILKLPSADHGLSVFLLQKLMEYEPRLKEYIYVFDTPSSDLVTVQKLMHLANTIVVWGSDDAIEAVRKNAPVNAEIVEWGHKLSFCYIQDMNIPDSLLLKLAHHLFETNQLLCNSCQGIYLDTDNFEDIAAFGKRFAKILGEIEKEYMLPDYLQGKLTLEALTRRLENTDQKEIIYQNQRSSVICKRDSDLELSMLYGNVWVKPLKPERIGAALHKSKLYLQTAGIYPLSTSLIQKLSRTGLTKITGIGEMSKKQLGMTHDGRFSLQQYVRLVEEIYELSGEEKHEREQ